MERTIQKKVLVSGGSWVMVDVYGTPKSPGLVLVPGVMSDAEGWREVVRATKAWPSVSVVNRRGRAPSGPLTENYSVRSEVDDLATVLKGLGEQQTVFGWSYGGLIALLLAGEHPLRHVIAYEPVIPPFGRASLPALESAAAQGCWDRSVEIVNRQISGFPAEYVEGLRSDLSTWETLRRLSEPLYEEIRALSLAPVPGTLASLAEKVDLIIGEDNVGIAPYGTSFEGVRSRVPRASVHQLAHQGHLAHIQAPSELGRMLDSLTAIGTL